MYLLLSFCFPLLFSYSSCTFSSTSDIHYVGHEKVAVHVLNNVIRSDLFARMEIELRHEIDGIFNDETSFPGIVRSINFSIVNPLLEAMRRDRSIVKEYGMDLFHPGDQVRGFASILCSRGFIHGDYLGGMANAEDVPPAAVFYFGFPQFYHHGRPRRRETGTAFFKEKHTGNGVTTAPSSRVEWSTCQDDLFEETLRLEGVANRLILYPQHVFHNAWHDGTTRCEEEEEGSNNNINLPCRAMDGRLAISLFFHSKGGKKIGHG